MSFIDSRTVPDEERIERDLCIIGSGPAGIAIALEFAGTGRSVALIESGDLGPEDDVQSLNEGEIAGLPYPSLAQVRLRAFGGTTWHWGGNIRPFEPVDFGPRPWIEGSGWPVAHEDVDPYYERANAFFHLPDYAFDEDYWRRVNGAPWPFVQGQATSEIFHTVGEAGLYSGDTWDDAIESSENVDLFYRATVLEFVTDEAVRQVREVRARTPDGRILHFVGRHFVLAAGGIENPRLLLLSAAQQKEGLGNDHGLVGRYFQEHLTVPDFATLHMAKPNLSLSYYKGSDHPWGEAWGVIRMPDSLMREHALPTIRYQLATVTNAFNVHENEQGFKSLRYMLGLTDIGGSMEFAEHLAHVIADVDNLADAAYHRLVDHPDYPLVSLQVVHIGEQTPNASSAVRLADSLDRHGQRRAVLDWQVQETDNGGAWRTAQLLRRAFAEAGIGELALNMDERVFEARPPKPHFHHMGTTRMDVDPRRGVVDADCRVHRLDNLYIAGSSVFPTSGSANPTYTLVALAIRLADHLKQRLQS